MAKLAGLIDGMAAALQVSPSRVRTAAAQLRKHKLLSTGPRGSAAPEMTPEDATNLLLAILYDGELAEAHQTVRRLREATLVRFRQTSWGSSGQAETLPGNSFLVSSEGDPVALGVLIDTMLDWWVRYGTLAEGQDEGDDLLAMNLSLDIACPGYRATLRFANDCCLPWEFTYEWKSPEQIHYEAENKGKFAVRWDARKGPHIWSSRSVGEDCLYLIAQRLRGREWADEWETFAPAYDEAADTKSEAAVA